jgi:type II secretory pathway pseudopilin PulG
MLRQRHRRIAFTMIELLVVIAIIMLLTAIGVMAIPSAGDRNMQMAADQLQGWLLIQKQGAKRSGKPSGLQIEFDPVTLQATQCYYIQQPDDYMIPGGSCAVIDLPNYLNGKYSVVAPLTSPCPVQLQVPVFGLVAGNYVMNVTFASPTAPVDLVSAGVQAGDYLELNRGGGVYKIYNVTTNSVLITPSNPNDPLSGPPSLFTITAGAAAPTWGNSVFEYRIRRQPVRVSGEDVLQLPDGVVLDNTISAVTGTNKCINVPVRTVGASTYYEIVFSPQGGLVGRGSGSDQICALWLSNANNKTTPALIMAIQVHTGFIGVQPDAGAPDPYKFCRDGRSSGM